MMNLATEPSSSNDLLLDGEKLTIKDSLIEAEGHLKPLDEGATHRPTTSPGYEKHRIECLARTKQLQNAIVAHQRVPVEIWANIFVYCIGRPLLYLPPIRDQAIWKVMAVCSRWRQIALAEPRIWNNLQADDSRNAVYMNELVRDIFSNRGGECLIKYRSPYISCAQTWNDFVNLISTYPSRLQYIGLTFRNFFPPSTHGTPVRLERLESAYFSFMWQDIFDKTATPATDFFSSESLRSVTVSMKRSSSPFVWPGRISLPWAQLTDLNIGIISVSMIIPVLRNCRRLVQIYVELRGEITSCDGPQHPIRLCHLRSLQFASYSDYLNVTSFLGYLIVPELESLSFNEQNWSKWPQSSVLELIHRSKCPLKTLSAPDFALGCDEFVQLLRDTPELVDFFGYTKGYASDSLIDTIKTENLAPKMRVMDGICVKSLHSFLELLRNRRLAPDFEQGNWIQTTNIGIPENHAPIDEGYFKDAVEELKDLGIDINIYII